MIERRCDSWERFQLHLDDFFKKSPLERDRYIFRGQANAAWSLTSTLQRFIQGLAPSSDSVAPVAASKSIESQLLTNFRKAARGLDAKFNDLGPEQLQLLARHHGLPSAFMDWTRSPYVAAFFAMSDAALTRSQPPDEVAIWVLDLAMVAGDPRLEVLDEHEAVVVIPRAIEQQSTFVRILADDVSFEHHFSDALRKFILPASIRDQAISRLAYMRIDAFMLFRSLDAAAETAAARVRTLTLGGPHD